ncbi:MAG: DUF4979 domain-containing protein [Dysgonamonadaceae bacterium]|jgi:hypothetical protein|nr:DUF4979 domain-containing protein [Dysgonamonadaceae bacterium]
MFDNPRTIGPTFMGGGTNANNKYVILDGEATSTTSPNVLYFDLQAGYDSVNPTSWASPFNLVQFKFIIADYPVADAWTYDIYWVRTFRSIEELTAFASSGQ